MEKSGFFNSINGDRRYKANDFAEYFNSFITNGVFPNPSSNLKIIATDKMDVIMNPGKGWINGFIYINTSNLILNIDPADGVLNRIDRIVLRYNVEKREIRAVVKKGEFASEPVAPLLQRDADMYELALADIFVAKGAISIYQGDITDVRLNTKLCGIVNSLIQADTSAIFTQYLEWFNRKSTEYAKQYEDWKDAVQNDGFATYQQLREHENNHVIHRIVCTSTTKPKVPKKGQTILCIDTLEEFTWNGTEWDQIRGSGSSGSVSIKDVIYSILQKLEDKEIKERYLSKTTQENLGFIYSLLKNLDVFDLSRSTSRISNNKAYSGELITNEYALPNPIDKIDVTLTQNEKIAYIKENMTDPNKFKTDSNLKIGDSIFYNNELYEIIDSTKNKKDEYSLDLSNKILSSLSNSGMDKEDIKQIIRFKNNLYFLTNHRLIKYGDKFTLIKRDDNYTFYEMVAIGQLLYITSRSSSVGKLLVYDGEDFTDMTSTITPTANNGKIYNLTKYKDGIIFYANNNLYLFRDGSISTLYSNISVSKLRMYQEDTLIITYSKTFKILDILSKSIRFTATLDQDINYVAGYGDKVLVQLSDNVLKMYDNNTNLFTTSQCNASSSQCNASSINSKIEQHENTLWFASSYNLYKYDLNSDTIQEKTSIINRKGTLEALYLDGENLYISTNDNSKFLDKYVYGNIAEYTVNKELPLFRAGYGLRITDIDVYATTKKEETSINTGTLTKVNNPYNVRANEAGSSIVELEGDKKLKIGDKIEGIRIKKCLSQNVKDTPTNQSDLSNLLPSDTHVLAANSFEGQLYVLTVTNNKKYNSTHKISLYRYNGLILTKICEKIDSISKVAYTEGKLNFIKKDNIYIDCYFYGAIHNINKYEKLLFCFRVSLNKDTLNLNTSFIGLCHEYRNQFGSIKTNDPVYINSSDLLNYINSDHPILKTLGYNNTGKIYSGSFINLTNSIFSKLLTYSDILEILSTSNRSHDIFIRGNDVYVYDNVKVKYLDIGNSTNYINGGLMFNDKALIYGNKRFTFYDPVQDKINALEFNHNVYDVVIYNDMLIAATSNGIYKYKDGIFIKISSDTKYTRLAVLKSNDVQQIDRLYAFEAPIFANKSFKFDYMDSLYTSTVSGESNNGYYISDSKSSNSYYGIKIDKIKVYHKNRGGAFVTSNNKIYSLIKSYKVITNEMRPTNEFNINYDFLGGYRFKFSLGFEYTSDHTERAYNLKLDITYKFYTLIITSTSKIKRFDLSDSVNAYELELPLSKDLETDVKYEEIDLVLEFQKLSRINAEPSNLARKFNVRYFKKIKEKGKFLRSKFDIPKKSVLDDFAIYLS